MALAKIETTIGTDAVPTVTTASSDAILLLEPIADPGGDFAFHTERPKLIVGAAIQASPPLQPLGRWAAWPLKFHARGTRAGTAYSATNLPEFDPILQASGLAQTLVTTGGSESVSYAPLAAGAKTATLYYYVDGSLRKILGGTTSKVDFDMASGGPLIIDASVEGIYSGATDVAILATPAFAYGSAVPPVCSNVALSIDGFSAGIIRSFKASMTNTTTGPRGSLNVAASILPARIRDRKIAYTIVLEMELVATIDFEAAQIANSGSTLSWAIPGTQYIGAISWTSPNAHIEKVKYGNDKGTMIVTIEGGMYDSAPATNNAFTVKFA
jgi:hypothetical protein